MRLIFHADIRHRCINQKRSFINKYLELAATLQWFTAGGAIRIAVRQLSQTRKLRHYDVIDDVIKDTEKRRPHRSTTTFAKPEMTSLMTS